MPTGFKENFMMTSPEPVYGVVGLEVKAAYKFDFSVEFAIFADCSIDL